MFKVPFRGKIYPFFHSYMARREFYPVRLCQGCSAPWNGQVVCFGSAPRVNCHGYLWLKIGYTGIPQLLPPVQLDGWQMLTLIFMKMFNRIFIPFDGISWDHHSSITFHNYGSAEWNPHESPKLRFRMPPATMPFSLAAHSVGSKASAWNRKFRKQTGIYAGLMKLNGFKLCLMMFNDVNDVYTGLMMFNACAQYYLAIFCYIISLSLCIYWEAIQIFTSEPGFSEESRITRIWGRLSPFWKRWKTREFGQIWFETQPQSCDTEALEQMGPQTQWYIIIFSIENYITEY